MIAVTDPFMADVSERRPGDFYRTAKGVPLVADANGTMTKPKNRKDPGHVKRVMYRRPSSFGKQIESTYNLQKWGERQQALGFALDYNLLKQAQALLEGDREAKEWKDEADRIVVAAKQTAKAWIAADRGTHGHGLAEDDDEGRDIIGRIEHGESLGLASDVQHALVEAWRAMLERTGLEILAVEFAMVNDAYKAAGTGDRVARLTRSLRFRLVTGELVELTAGTVLILDIKTGKRRIDTNGVVMYWQSYAVQVALYAGGCLYDPDTDTRTPFPWPVDQDWALIAHLDVLGAMEGNPSCELVLVDLKAGRAAADLCVAARAWEHDSTVFSVAQLPADRPSADATGGSSSTLGGEIDAGGADPSPASPATLVEGADDTSAGPGAPSTELTASRDRHPATTSDPARLALVKARDALNPTPSEGRNHAARKDVWNRLRAEFDNLPPAAKKWRSELAQRATQRGVSFMAQEAQTERRYYINRGLITLAIVSPDDDILRIILALILGDVAWILGIEPGHLVGSLDHVQAVEFARLVDEYVATPISPPPAA